MKFSLEDKVAIVTGGGSGIGRAISMTFAEQGAHVCILDFNVEGGKQTQQDIEKAGGKSSFYACDVANKAQVEEIFEVINQKNPIHIVVNNAGIAHVGNIENTDEADLDRLYAVNIKGVYNCMQAGVKKMKGRGGVIINMASIASSNIALLSGSPEIMLRADFIAL